MCWGMYMYMYVNLTKLAYTAKDPLPTVKCFWQV